MNQINQITNLGISSLEAKELLNVKKNINKCIKKLKKGYPIQYLIGYVNFYGYKIYVNKNVLIPRPETEFLVEKTIKLIKEKNIKHSQILDLCTGSGCIAISLKKEIKSSTIDASDISSKALKMLKRNSKYNSVQINIIKSNLFKNINKKYDVIVSNPPYVSFNEQLSKTVLFEPKKALFSLDNGLSHIKQIINTGFYYLNDKGFMALEINSYGEKELEKLLNKNYNYKFEKDLTGKIRYLFIFKNE